MSEEEARLRIDVARLDPAGEELVGEVDIIDLDEEFVKPFGGVRYRLKAQLFGNELLVRGHLEQDFTLVCSRCDKDFDTTISTDEFTFSSEVAANTDYVDLTADAREALILNLPTYPLCDEACPGLPQKKAVLGDNRWSALDGLKVG